MIISAENSEKESQEIEKRLRDEVFLLDPSHRDCFMWALFDKKTNCLHGTKYVLHYQDGKVSLR
jgi:hypothetical protein